MKARKTDNTLESLPRPTSLSEIFRAKVIKPSTDLKSSLAAFGLDWETGIRKVCMSDKHRTPIPGFFATYRTDTNQPLGLVRGRYQPQSNYESMRWIESLNLLGSEANFGIEFGGTIKGGEKSFIGVRLSTGQIRGETITRYMVLINSNDGQSNFLIELLAVREASMSVLNLPGGDFKVRHTKNFADKLAEIDKKVARPFVEGASAFYTEIEQMMDTKLDALQRKGLIENILDVSPRESDEWYADTSKKQPFWVNWYKNIEDLVENGPGAELAGKDTLWGVYTAAVNYFDHVRPVRGTEKTRADIGLESRLLGSSAHSKIVAYLKCKSVLN